MSNDTAGHPQVDFVWGNFPMQPNDERGVDVLDPILDSHEIAYLGWNGFPNYAPNTTNGNAGSGSGSNLVTVPGVVGRNWSELTSILFGAGLAGYGSSTITNGATTQNNGVVLTQSPAPGAQVARGIYIEVTYYSFVGLPTNVDTQWALDASGALVSLSNFPWTSLLQDLQNNPTNYQVVVAGISGTPYSDNNGTYPITSISATGSGILIGISGLTLAGGQSALASSDQGGTISIEAMPAAA